MVTLKASKLFSGLTSDALTLLEGAAERRSFAVGQTIFTEGDEGDGLYVIAGGLVQISALVTGQQRWTLSRLEPGEFFGEMAVLDDRPRSATAIAEQESVLYFVPRALMMEMLERCPGLAISLMRQSSLRLREFNRQHIHEMLQAERLALVGRFARSIVHDFKNPLNVIGIAADIAAMDTATAEMRNMARSRIRRQIENLSSMINELLEFTRGPRGAVVLASTDWRVFVERILQDRKRELQETGIALEFETSPPAVMLPLDPARLSHVFQNLINNAVDAMPEGGKITLRSAVDGNEVATEIEDSGKGIAPEISNRLFDAFVTFGKSNGTGLGLSICKRIIEDHGGRIDARNRPGGGAIFHFRLPLPATGPEAPSDPRRPDPVASNPRIE